MSEVSQRLSGKTTFEIDLKKQYIFLADPINKAAHRLIMMVFSVNIRSGQQTSLAENGDKVDKVSFRPAGNNGDRQHENLPFCKFYGDKKFSLQKGLESQFWIWDFEKTKRVLKRQQMGCPMCIKWPRQTFAGFYTAHLSNESLKYLCLMTMFESFII